MPNWPIDACRRTEINTHWLSGSATAAGDEQAQMEPRDLGPDGSGSSQNVARGGEKQDRDIFVSDAGSKTAAGDDRAGHPHKS